MYSRGLRIFIVTFYMNLGSIANFVQLLVFYFKLSGPFYRNEYLHYIYIYTIVFLWYMNILQVFFRMCNDFKFNFFRWQVFWRTT